MATFFVAGIIQGSRADDAIHPQGYRDAIVGMLRRTFPDSEVYCPIENYPNSLAFTEEQSRDTFLGLMERAGQADVLVAYVPEASMGTAIEMWQAHRTGRLVVAISPLSLNWVVRFVSTVLLPDVAAFEAFVRDGTLARLMSARGL